MTQKLGTAAPLEDPTYEPKHPPVGGGVPPVVAKWGPRSQVRWFRRFAQQLSPRRDWDRFFCSSVEHVGPCCFSCDEELMQGEGVQLDGWCCCRDGRLGR
jgi:hypothetical protein